MYKKEDKKKGRITKRRNTFENILTIYLKNYELVILARKSFMTY